ncbi:MAG: sigma-70 family RNA polymerase sigma factor [Alphaproteobacteria bacterium]|nr:sigma-70 family RNA polymerase sigma factor [Alphaproteobacteria bacterium]
MTPHDEARLLGEARRGGTRAFAFLVEAHQQSVRGFLRRLVGNHADADDLAQEAFVTAWRRLRRFEGRARFGVWVCGIGYRLARDQRRARGRAMARDAAWLDAHGPAEAEHAGEALSDARTLLAMLPEDQRAAVALCLGCGFSHADAAEALGMPLGTVKSHVQRGRARLQALVGEVDADA